MAFVNCKKQPHDNVKYNTVPNSRVGIFTERKNDIDVVIHGVWSFSKEGGKTDMIKYYLWLTNSFSPNLYFLSDPNFFVS